MCKTHKAGGVCVCGKEMVAGRQESGGLLPAHCTSPTLSPARDFFFFLLLPPYLWSRAALLIEDGEIKTEQVHVEVEINCGEKKEICTGFQTEDAISGKSIFSASYLHVIICIRTRVSAHFFEVHVRRRSKSVAANFLLLALQSHTALSCTT